MWLVGFSLPPFDPTAVDPAWGAFFRPTGRGQLAQLAAVLLAAGWVMWRVGRREAVRLA
jgi:hypothetical protein